VSAKIDPVEVARRVIENDTDLEAAGMGHLREALHPKINGVEALALAKVVIAASEVIEKRGLLMHLLVNKPNPWTPPIYDDYYDIPATEIDALAAALKGE